MKKMIPMLFLILLASYSYGEEKQHEPLTEELSETTHSVLINGKNIPYKATAGTLVLKDEKDKDKASIFYIAYTREDIPNQKNRPITFCFNGGPGSSAIWLHLGVFGPRRAVLTDDGIAAPPYTLQDNPYSILDVTDLVFIDPVSTGYSRAAPGEDPKQFHGVDEDVKSVGEFIRLYTTRYNRWGSPKYIAGESYGTTRAAALAEHLQNEEHMYLSGLVLISSILNFQTTFDHDGNNDLPYILYLPTYTATAHYHKRLPQKLQERPLPELLREVEEFALNDYALALLQGDRLSESQKENTIQKLAYYTGLSPDYFKRSNLRVNIFRYAKELLRDEDRIVGRFDGRFTGCDLNCYGDTIENDPSADAVFGGFAAAMNDYIRSELNWKKDESYKVLANVWPWNYGKATNQYLNVANSLKTAMIRNPHLKIFVANGTYDLATPYFATDYTFNHLGLDPSLTSHIELKYYDAGHMMYIHKPSLINLKKDLAEFLRESDLALIKEK